MMGLELKTCSMCRDDLPPDNFHKNQTTCIKCRRKRKEHFIEKRKDKTLPESYRKKCYICKESKIAIKEFHKDSNTKDGYSQDCKVCTSLRRYQKEKLTYTILEGHPKRFKDKLLSLIFRDIKDSERSIVRQIVEDFLHENDPVSFKGREWQIDILNSLCPNEIIRKPSQTGLTWVFERFVFSLLLRYNDKPYKYINQFGEEKSRFPVAIYSFQSVNRASIWSRTRLKKLKRDNRFIAETLKKGETDQTLLMQLGRTELHLVGRGTISGVLSVDADIVIIDEKDRDQNPSVSSQIGSRTLSSVFMTTETTKGIIREASTPEVSGTGISLGYENSNQEEWEIKCVKCNTWQVLTYPECIGNFYDYGEEPLTDSKGKKLIPYWRCMKCYKPIDWNTIGQWNSKDPDHYKNGRWIARYPDRYNHETKEGTRGRQIPFADGMRTAAYFMSERDKPEHDQTYLHNHLLGFPYDDISKTLTPENFKSLPDARWGYTGKGLYVLGCDHHPAQGGFIVIWKQVPDSTTSNRPNGKWSLAYLEHVKKNIDLYDRYEDGEILKGRIYDLIDEYEIEIAVIDSEPDANEVHKLIREFSFQKTVWANKSGYYSQEPFRIYETDDDTGESMCRIVEDKVSAIDWLFNMIRFGEFLLCEDKDMSDRLKTSFINAHTNLYKGEVEQKVKRLKNSQQADILFREIYKKRLEGIHDHFCMANKFCSQAVRLLGSVERKLKPVIPPQIKGFGGISGIQK